MPRAWAEQRRKNETNLPSDMVTWNDMQGDLCLHKQTSLPGPREMLSPYHVATNHHLPGDHRQRWGLSSLVRMCEHLPGLTTFPRVQDRVILRREQVLWMEAAPLETEDEYSPDNGSMSFNLLECDISINKNFRRQLHTPSMKTTRWHQTHAIRASQYSCEQARFLGCPPPSAVQAYGEKTHREHPPAEIICSVVQIL